MEDPIHRIDKTLAVLSERVDRLFEANRDYRAWSKEEYARRLEELNGKAAQDERDRAVALLQIKEMDSKFVMKAHLDDMMKLINRKLGEHQSFRDKIEGKHSWSNLFAGAALLIVVIKEILNYIRP